MTLVHRVLSPEPILTLEAYLRARGGQGLEIAKSLEPDAIIAEVTDAGLRGRGGAGFPTGIKWRTVRDNEARAIMASTVVVNGAEGEPGTYKDRTILRTNPFAVVEGALIAALAVGADQVIFGLKRTFTQEIERLRTCVQAVQQAGWADGVELIIFEGPNEYLYGEETALLETMDGRSPLPRVSPPFRRGVRELVETPADAAAHSALASHVEMAGPEGETGAPPTLVDNVETLANIARIVARGASWFRTEGTDQSPGTIVSTVIGDVQREGVGEVIMGTPLGEVIEEISGGPRPDHRIKAVLAGVSGAVITADMLDAPVSYEGLAAAGSGLGSGGFIVFDERSDAVAIAAGASRFLAVESCGQCVPCKQDGLELSHLLADLCANNGSESDLAEIRKRADTVGERARCSLATQHQVVLGSLLERFPADFEAHLRATAAPVAPVLVAELVGFEGDESVLDERHLAKQPDWTYDAEDSGQTPADRLGEHRVAHDLED